MNQLALFISLLDLSLRFPESLQRISQLAGNANLQACSSHFRPSFPPTFMNCRLNLRDFRLRFPRVTKIYIKMHFPEAFKDLVDRDRSIYDYEITVSMNGHGTNLEGSELKPEHETTSNWVWGAFQQDILGISFFEECTHCSISRLPKITIENTPNSCTAHFSGPHPVITVSLSPNPNLEYSLGVGALHRVYEYLFPGKEKPVHELGGYDFWKMEDLIQEEIADQNLDGYQFQILAVVADSLLHTPEGNFPLHSTKLEDLLHPYYFHYEGYSTEEAAQVLPNLEKTHRISLSDFLSK